jgi:hypothetical protein
LCAPSASRKTRSIADCATSILCLSLVESVSISVLTHGAAIRFCRL